MHLRRATGYNSRDAPQIFVTTALPYANGPFHIGHIMEYIQADIWVRFQRMQGTRVHFVCADDAHGAPIMLTAESRGHHARSSSSPRIAAEPAEYLRRLPHRIRPLALDGLAREHASCRRTSIAAASRRLIYVKPVEQFYDPVKGMFLADRYIKGECPNCHAKDQYGDTCEVCSTVYAPTELINPYSTLSGATPVLHELRALFLQAVGSAVRRVPARAGSTRPAACSRRCANKAREWLDGRRRGGARRLGHLARRALLRHSRSRMRRASTSTCGWMRRSATSPR